MTVVKTSGFFQRDSIEALNVLDLLNDFCIELKAGGLVAIADLRIAVHALQLVFTSSPLADRLVEPSILRARASVEAFANQSINATECARRLASATNEVRALLKNELKPSASTSAELTLTNSSLALARSIILSLRKTLRKTSAGQ